MDDGEVAFLDGGGNGARLAVTDGEAIDGKNAADL
jgi:hypothetical protein